MSSKSKIVESICRKLCIIRGQNPNDEIPCEFLNDNKDTYGSVVTVISYQPRWQIYIKEVELYLDINYALHNLPDE